MSMQPNKVTLKTEDVIIQLLSHYFKMRNQLYKLIQRFPRYDISAKEIYPICKALPKSLQRNKNKYNQLVLAQQLSRIVNYFNSNKSKAFSKKTDSYKYKPYQLYLALKQYTDIISDRIRTSVRGNLYQIANNQQNLKLFYLINQLQFLTHQIELWVINRDRNTLQSPNQNIQFIYPENATNRKTLATTAAPSKNLSKYQKSQNIYQTNQKRSNYCLLRASTAKIQKKNVKLSTRCPSAAALLKNQSFKQPLFEPKKSIIKYKHKSTDFQDKSNKNIDFRENNNIFFQQAKHSRFRQKKLTTGKQRKISILNKTLKDEDDMLKVKSSKKFLNQSEKLRKTGMQMVRKKEVKMNILSNEQIGSNQNEGTNKKIAESSCQILDGEDIIQIKDRKAINISVKDLKLASRMNVESSSSENTSLSSSFMENEQNTLYIKQRQAYKKARRSGKVLIRDNDQLRDIYQAPKTKVTTIFNRRRKAMLSTHNQEMTEIQNMMNLQKQQNAKKKLQYDQNVLLSMSQALKPKQKGNIVKQTGRQSSQKQSFNFLFQEINSFLKDFIVGKSQNADSVFFEQQKRIRSLQDHDFKQKMKQIVKSNGTANIFELSSSQVSNKDQIYNQIHRYLSFKSDSQWIKHMYTPKQPLIQQSL